MNGIKEGLLRIVRFFGRTFGTGESNYGSPGDCTYQEMASHHDHPDTEAREKMSASGLSLELSPKKVMRGLILIVTALVLLSLLSGFVALFGGPWMQMFDVGNDLSLPAWYSALALLLASILLATVAFAKKASEDPSYARHWAILAAIFLYLSCDEMLRLHERIAITLLWPSLEALGYTPTGIFYYYWTIVYVPLLLIFILAYLKFWMDLPARIRSLFLAAGAIFVGGAVGAEMFSSWYESTFGAGGAFLWFMAQIEELMEMLGIVVFVYALMRYLGSHLRIGELRLCLKDET